MVATDVGPILSIRTIYNFGSYCLVQNNNQVQEMQYRYSQRTYSILKRIRSCVDRAA